MGALTFDALLQSLKQRAPDPVYYLHGEEDVLKDEAVRALLERSEEHTSELQSQSNLVCRLLLEKKIAHIDSQHHFLEHNLIMTQTQQLEHSHIGFVRAVQQHPRRLYPQVLILLRHVPVHPQPT